MKEGYGFEDRLSAQFGAGVRVRLTSRTAFRGEATCLLRSEQSDFDPLLSDPHTQRRQQQFVHGNR